MRSYTFHLFAILFLLTTFSSYGQNDTSTRKFDLPETNDEIVLLDSSMYLYKAGDFLISGQPNKEIFPVLKTKGLGLVVNIRTPEEMEKVKEDGFDEAAYLDSLKIPYVNVPIGGSAGFTKEAIQNINKSIQEHDGMVMIHCRSAGRATNAWIAWLANYYHVPLDEAVSMGKQMRFHLSLEDLLGYEVSYSKKE